MKTINLTFEELTAIKHESNLQAFRTFKNYAEKTGILESAPWESVLDVFIQWKQETELNAKNEHQEKYIDSVNEAVEEYRTLINAKNN